MQYKIITLDDQSPFDTIQEMDNTVRRYNSMIKKTHYETLNVLKQYSCKYIGVSHLKIQTIATRVGKSIATIKRHLKYLKDNGFISISNTKRQKKKGQGANIYVINPFDVYEKIQAKLKNELPEMSYRNRDKKHNEYQSQQGFRFVAVKKQTINTFKLLNSFISTKRRKKQIRLNREENIKYFRSCPEGVPFELYQKFRPFFSDGQIKSLYNAITKQTNNDSRMTSEEYTDIVDNSFNALVKALRKSHRGEMPKIQNIFGYASAVAKRQTLKLITQKLWGFA